MKPDSIRDNEYRISIEQIIQYLKSADNKDYEKGSYQYNKYLLTTILPSVKLRFTFMEDTSQFWLAGVHILSYSNKPIESLYEDDVNELDWEELSQYLIPIYKELEQCHIHHIKMNRKKSLQVVINKIIQTLESATNLR